MVTRYRMANVAWPQTRGRQGLDQPAAALCPRLSPTRRLIPQNKETYENGNDLGECFEDG